MQRWAANFTRLTTFSKHTLMAHHFPNAKTYLSSFSFVFSANIVLYTSCGFYLQINVLRYPITSRDLCNFSLFPFYLYAIRHRLLSPALYDIHRKVSRHLVVFLKQTIWGWKEAKNVTDANLQAHYLVSILSLDYIFCCSSKKYIDRCRYLSTFHRVFCPPPPLPTCDFNVEN